MEVARYIVLAIAVACIVWLAIRNTFLEYKNEQLKAENTLLHNEIKEYKETNSNVTKEKDNPPHARKDQGNS